jgi:hypothetical protein
VLGQYDFNTSTYLQKSLKGEVFISFNMEFKLKTSENHIKSFKKSWDSTTDTFMPLKFMKK